jgi:hypothetical protein
MSSPDHKNKDLPATGTGHVLEHSYNGYNNVDIEQPSAAASQHGNDKASFMSDDQDEGVTRIEALCK